VDGVGSAGAEGAGMVIDQLRDLVRGEKGD